MYQAVEQDSGAVLAGRLRMADTHWTRMRGLLGTSELPAGEGLWIKPCNQVHMFGMRYPIDVLFLDEAQAVLHAEHSLMPWKVSPKVTGARSVIEVPAGTLARIGLQPGARVDVDGEPEARESAWLDAAGAILCNLLLAALYCFFTAAHIKGIRETGHWASVLPFVAQEGMLVFLFLTRRRSFGTTGNVFDWLVGISGTFLPLLLRPAADLSTLWVIGMPIQIVGFICAIFGLMSLGRSIGIVAANRGVQTDGFYRFVRHPMYASYMITYLGYTFCYPTPRNLILIGATFLLLYLGVQAEERFLTRDPAYRDYLQRVPWRFVPRVY